MMNISRLYHWEREVLLHSPTPPYTLKIIALSLAKGMIDPYTANLGY